MTRTALVVVCLGLAGSALAGTGDVNADGKVTTADALLAMKMAGGLLKSTATQAAAADVSPDAPDGIVMLADAVRLARVALGIDPAFASGLMPYTGTLVVSGNGTRKIVMPGGYAVSGKLTDSTGKVFTGSIAFSNTTTSDVSDSSLLDTSTGAFSENLAAGTYQPVAVTTATRTTSGGENETVNTASAVGSPITVAGAVSGLAFKRAAMPTPPVLTLNFSGPSAPFMTTAYIYLTDSGLTPATYGLNYVERDITFTPATVNVPAGTYDVEVDSQTALSNTLNEDLAIWYYQRLTVSGALSKTLAFPQLYELGGAITGPSSVSPVDVYAELQPVGTADASAAYVQVDQYGVYLAAIQPGSQYISIGVTSPHSSTDVYFVFPYTMAAKKSTKNIVLPALPSFRTITGTVSSFAGKPAAGVTIEADSDISTYPAAGVNAFVGNAVTDASGSFTLYLPDGPYLLYATS